MIRAYDDWGNVVDMVEHDKKVRADAIDEVIKIARAEIDFENQAEQKRFVEFMKSLKEQKDDTQRID